MALTLARTFGEPRIEDAYRFVLEPYLQERYSPFDIRERPYEDTLYRNLYLSFEAMRGHLGGPGRLGDMELEEHEDRIVIRFDPCGSGGRGRKTTTSFCPRSAVSARHSVVPTSTSSTRMNALAGDRANNQRVNSRTKASTVSWSAEPRSWLPISR